MTPTTQSRWTRRRRAVQIAVIVSYGVLPFANLRGLRAVNGTLAALKVGAVDFIEPAGAFSTVLASRTLASAVLLGVAPLLVLALVLGPVFCSWICLWGFISEGIDRLRHGNARCWTDQPALAAGRPRIVSLLAFAAASVLLGTPAVAWISPPRLVASSALELVYFRAIAPVTLTLLLALVLVEIFAPRRLWCRALCPLGGFVNYLRHRGTLAPRVTAAQCTCVAQPLCYVHCAWGLDPRHMRRTDGCTNCMRCVDVCPSAAVKPRFQQYLRQHESHCGTDADLSRRVSANSITKSTRLASPPSTGMNARPSCGVRTATTEISYASKHFGRR